MEEFKQQLGEAIAKQEEYLLCGYNDEVLNDKIKELKSKLNIS